MSTPNTFLIFGANGWIGNQVINYLSEQKIPYIKARSRANDSESIIQELNANPQITHIMSFIGRTHGIAKNVDSISLIWEQAAFLNTTKPIHLAKKSTVLQRKVDPIFSDQDIQL